MYAKLLVTTIALVAVAATLLLWRQQRLELTHAMIDANRRVRQIQQAIWQQETDAARLLAPHRLIDDLQATRIAVEPTKPLRGSAPQSRFAEAVDVPSDDAAAVAPVRHVP